MQEVKYPQKRAAVHRQELGMERCIMQEIILLFSPNRRWPGRVLCVRHRLMIEVLCRVDIIIGLRIPKQSK